MAMAGPITNTKLPSAENVQCPQQRTLPVISPKFFKKEFRRSKSEESLVKAIAFSQQDILLKSDIRGYSSIPVIRVEKHASRERVKKDWEV